MDSARRSTFLRALSLDVDLAVALTPDIAEAAIRGAAWRERLGV